MDGIITGRLGERLSKARIKTFDRERKGGVSFAPYFPLSCVPKGRKIHVNIGSHAYLKQTVCNWRQSEKGGVHTSKKP